MSIARSGKMAPSFLGAVSGSHYSRRFSHRWCCLCKNSVPSAGGHMRGTLFVCAGCKRPEQKPVDLFNCNWMKP